jgi:hypothetical protein
LAYTEAKDKFRESKNSRSELLASVYQAREEFRLGNVDMARELIAPYLDIATDARFADHEGLKQVAAKELARAVN